MAPSKRRLLFALAGALCVPVVVACNGIVGISDYNKAECSGGGGLPCTDAEVPDGPVIDGGKDADSSVVPDGGVGADPVSWARWRMPNYALDAAAPQPPNAPMLNVDGGINEVEDIITQLVWRATLQNGGAPSTLEAARQSCAALAPAGTWRLPKRIELVTLLDFGHEKPFIGTRAFVGFPPVVVWSSSEVRPFVGGSEQAYWTVSFNTGIVEGQKGNAAAALCVKAK